MVALRRQGCVVWMSLLTLAATVRSLGGGALFQYGRGAGDRLLEQGTDGRQELVLDKPLLFYDGAFSSVHISTNGFVAVAQPTDESDYLGKMPASFGMIAAGLGNLDTSDGLGKVFFRQDTRPQTLRKASEHIARAFPEDVEVEPIHAVVVTWENVAPQGSLLGDVRHIKRNTFQLVVASTDNVSYAILLYPRDGLQFYSTPVGGENEPIQVGFSKGLETGWFTTYQGPYYRVTTSDEASFRDLSEKTNSGTRGVWVYEIGTSPFFTVVAPGEVTDLSVNVPEDEPWERFSTEEGEAELVTEFPENEPGPQHVAEWLAPTWTPSSPSPDSPGDTVDAEPTAGVLYRSPHQSQPRYSNIFEPQRPHYQPDNPLVVVVDEGEINVDVFSYNYETCANRQHKCSTFADCRDYTLGYCCHCRPGYYGNGKQCVAEGKPQRMNGKVSGKVFVGNSWTPLVFSNNDLHSYVVANDGRAYVAISTIPPSLGPSLLPLSSLGGIIGWAFALEQPGYENGFSIAGGQFTRQAEVTFLPGNEKLTIKQEFKGIDEHDHLAVSTDLDGSLPEVPQGSTVQIEPYSEVYQYSSSMITSSSLREYTVTLADGSTQTRSYQWRQTILYESCPYSDASALLHPTQQLRVDQIFVLYDEVHQLIRYAMSNKIGSIHSGVVEQNPCFTGRHGCDTNAACRPGQGTQFTCECAAGFTGDGRTCYDIDECKDMPQICGHHTICNNQPGTFRCECIQGYQFAGDGQTCIEMDQPVDHCQTGTHSCDDPERARCIYTGGSSYICSCLPGFQGDGRACHDIDECQQERCHPDAVCFNSPGAFNCQCKPGFHGDGFHCSSGPSEHETTHCQRHRDSVLAASSVFSPRGPRPIPGQYVPTCDSLGRYEPMQCDHSIGQCWCVDRKGQEIPGTRTGPGSTPMCIDQGIVPTPVGPTPRPDVTPLTPGTHILFAQSGKIEHIPLVGYSLEKNDAKALLHLPDKVVVGLAYDCVERMVYFTDISGPSISKAGLQGGEPILLIQTDLESPEGIAVDHLGRTMFWTDSVRDVIEVASLDGNQRRVLIDTDLVNPRAIVTDSANGYLYWADWNREAPKIEAAYMDGTNRRVLVKDDLGLPNGLTYDPQTSLLCWADAGTHRVECMNPGLGKRWRVLEGIQYPFAITSHGKNLYYTDWRREAVMVVDRPGGKNTDEFIPQKRSRVYGIATAYAQCPAGQNYCNVNNGGCTHLCLATPTGRSCLCPNKVVGTSCVEGESRY